MRTHILMAAFVAVIANKVTSASKCNTRQSESGIFLYGFLMESSTKVNSLSTCTSKCKNNMLCTSINLNLVSMMCDLNNSTKKRHPKNVKKQPNMVYMEIRDHVVLGSMPYSPIPSCKWLKEYDSLAKSGVYWMKFNDLASEPFQVFCEMTIHGGGWTLVYSYMFTQFNSFHSTGNAVSPMPNWAMDRSSGTWVPQSTKIPLSESAHSAMDFALWKKIGKEFLMKSNITNWVACVERTGSLVHWKSGSVTCKVVKAITSTCTTVIPTSIMYSSFCGAGLYGTKHYIFLEGRTDNCWPVHDPCGTMSSGNHLTNVPSPGGAIYIR